MTERMTLAQLREAQKESKGVQRVIGARRTFIEGVGWFDSHKEANRYTYLNLLQKAGEIKDLERQVSIGLEGKNGAILTKSGKSQRSYIADFRYRNVNTGDVVIEDVKSGDFRTEVYDLKRAILAAQGIVISEV